MADTKTKDNVYTKLIEARADFLAKGIKKSGKNDYAGFNYYELDDIVPTVTEIFKKRGLLSMFFMSRDTAEMDIIDCDEPNDGIRFTAPVVMMEPIVGKSGKAAMNPLQCLGSTITYMRRYLYQMAMDICEKDEMDGIEAVPAQSNDIYSNEYEPVPPRNTSARDVSQSQSQPKQERKATKDQISDKQERFLHGELKRNGWSETMAKKVIKADSGKEHFSELSQDEFQRLLNTIHANPRNQQPQPQVNEGFVDIPDGVDDTGLPFN